MSLADDLKQYGTASARPCSVCDWYLTLDRNDRKAFDEFVPSGGTRTALHRIAVKNGLQASREKVFHHVDQAHVPG